MQVPTCWRNGASRTGRVDAFSFVDLPFKTTGPVDNSRFEMIKLHTVPIVADLTVQFELQPATDEGK